MNAAALMISPEERAALIGDPPRVGQLHPHHEVARERVKQQEAIAALAQQALGGLEFSALMQKAADAIVETLRVEFCEILELLSGGRQLLLKAGAGWNKGLVGQTTIEAGGNSHGGFTLLSDQPVIVEDLRRETRFRASALLREHGVVSGLSVIIRGPSKRFGVLGAYSRTQRRFNADDIHFHQAVANLLALAIERNEAEQRLKFQTHLLANIHDAVFSMDGRWRLTSWNPAAEAIYGWKEVEALQQPVERILGKGCLGVSLKDARRRLAEAGCLESEAIHRRKDGTPVHIEAKIMTLRSPLGRLTGYVSVNRDITRRRKIEEERSWLASIVESSDDAIIARRLNGAILSWNRGAEQIFGYTADEILGRPFSTLVPQDRLAEAREIELQIIRGERVEHYETLRVRKDGCRVPVSLTSSPIKGPTGQIIGISAIARDLSQRRQLQAALVEINETVQRQVGQDLHDGLCQRLRGVAYLTEVLQRNLADQSRPENADAARIARLLNEAIAETRNLARGLSPIRLETDGLMSGLRELAANTASIYGMACRFVCPRPVLIAQQVAAIHLYRIAQEAVQNAIQHGKARRVTLRLLQNNSRVELVVRDNGKGISKHRGREEGMGLKIMDYRARIIGAVLSVQPAGDGGTVVKCALRLGRSESPTANSQPVAAHAKS